MDASSSFGLAYSCVPILGPGSHAMLCPSACSWSYAFCACLLERSIVIDYPLGRLTESQFHERALLMDVPATLGTNLGSFVYYLGKL
ncbi:hypothetical protein GY45DRAFT_1118523 [Cubamyces sp. BRFM 1775]|nr:hypothetical protein GY45DRAFT_1118523 [Cubamyces sp. BRFM 1775]